MDLLFRLRIACNFVLVANQYKQILLTGAGFQHLCFTHLGFAGAGGQCDVGLTFSCLIRTILIFRMGPRVHPKRCGLVSINSQRCDLLKKRRPHDLLKLPELRRQDIRSAVGPCAIDILAACQTISEPLTPGLLVLI